VWHATTCLRRGAGTGQGTTLRQAFEGGLPSESHVSFLHLLRLTAVFSLQVNLRLSKEEADHAIAKDPTSQHRQWPLANMCGNCRQGSNDQDPAIDWDEDEVYNFFLGYYGQTTAAHKSTKEAAGMKRTKQAHWIEALLVTIVVVGTVFATLHKSAHYSLKKNLSKLRN
jgi:hypothetical protein